MVEAGGTLIVEGTLSMVVDQMNDGVGVVRFDVVDAGTSREPKAPVAVLALDPGMFLVPPADHVVGVPATDLSTIVDSVGPGTDVGQIQALSVVTGPTALAPRASPTQTFVGSTSSTPA